MTEEDIRKLEVKYSETKIQHICVTWFRETFPNVGLYSLLYQTAASEQRKAVLCANMKVPSLVLLT